MSLEIREEVQSADINLEIASIWMTFKAKRVGEVTKCLSVHRKEKRSKEQVWRSTNIYVDIREMSRHQSRVSRNS
jgi:hypothetical protein